MSGEATGYVWHFSPVTKGALLVHLALADVANDMHSNELWCSVGTIAKKTRLGRSTVIDALDELVAMQMLTVLEKRPGRTDKYRFEYPLVPIQFSDRSTERPIQESNTGVQNLDGGGPGTGPELNRTEADNFFDAPPFDDEPPAPREKAASRMRAIRTGGRA